MIARSVWPAVASFLNLPPDVRFPEGDAFRKILERHNLFKLAWLTETGHKRPGIPAGVPIAKLPRIPEGASTKAGPEAGAAPQPRCLKDTVPIVDFILDAVRQTAPPCSGRIRGQTAQGRKNLFQAMLPAFRAAGD